MNNKKRQRNKSNNNIKTPSIVTADIPPTKNRFIKAWEYFCNSVLMSILSLFIGIVGIGFGWYWQNESAKWNSEFLDQQKDNTRLLSRIEANWGKVGLEWLWVNYEKYNHKYPGGFTIFFGQEGLPNFIGLPTIPNSLGYFDGFKDVQIKWDESNSDLIILHINHLQGPQATTARDIDIGISIKKLFGNRKRLPLVLGSDNDLYTWVELIDDHSNGFMVILGRGYENSY